MDVNTRFVYILMDPRLLMIIDGQINSLKTATLVLDGEQISRSGLRLQQSSKACRGHSQSGIHPAPFSSLPLFTCGPTHSDKRDPC